VLKFTIGDVYNNIMSNYRAED